MVDEFVDEYSCSQTKKEGGCSGDVHVLGVLVRMSGLDGDLFAVVCRLPDVIAFPAHYIFFSLRRASNNGPVLQSCRWGWVAGVGVRTRSSRSKPREMNP